MSSFEEYKRGWKNVKLIEEMSEELYNQPELRDELFLHFQGLDGTKGIDELSACLTFFLLGRLYEQNLKSTTKGAAKNASSRM
jgi:hypothetical protein